MILQKTKSIRHTQGIRNKTRAHGKHIKRKRKEITSTILKRTLHRHDTNRSAASRAAWRTSGFWVCFFFRSSSDKPPTARLMCTVRLFFFLATACAWVFLWLRRHTWVQRRLAAFSFWWYSLEHLLSMNDKSCASARRNSDIQSAQAGERATGAMRFKRRANNIGKNEEELRIESSVVKHHETLTLQHASRQGSRGSALTHARAAYAARSGSSPTIAPPLARFGCKHHAHSQRHTQTARAIRQTRTLPSLRTNLEP